MSWVYDIGENSDCSVDALVSDNVADLVATFRDLPTAKATLRDQVRQPRAARPRPAGPHPDPVLADAEQDARLLDVRTSSIAERIAAIDDFVAAGYEVHLNLSPVVMRDGWERDWRRC